MADRTVMLRIGANISGLQSQLRAAQASVADFSKKSVSHIERNSASINTLSSSVGTVGVGLVALAGTAVTRFAQFDKAMSSVAATGDDARGSLDALRAAAIDAGADTAYSAQEAAGAIEQLAKAGVSAKDILGGGLAGALSLAAAGEIEVGQAAEIAASAMTQFNLKGTDVGHVADLLAAGAGKAQGGVGDMGQALNQAGLIAAQVGLSIEETTGSLAAMASAGLTGSDAGTSLKTALIALSSPSATAAKEMERLGISAYDANGNFVGMEALAGNLQHQLRGLSDEQRNSALATIFGSDALRTANVLYDQGALGVRKWTKAVDEQGYAAETARQQTNNLIGDVERLGGSLDSVFIQSGSGANDSLRGIVQGAEAAVDAIGELPAPVLNATTLIAGAGGLALLGVAGLGKLTTGFAEAKAAATALGISTKSAGLAAGGLGAALAVGTLAFAAWAQNAAEAKARTEEFQSTLDSFGKTTDATLSSINDRLSEDQNDFFDNLLGDDPESLIDRAERIGLAVEDLQGYILGNADATEKVTQATRDYIAAQGDELTSADIRARAGRFLTNQLDDEAGALTDAQKAAAQKQVADEAAGVAAEGLEGATEGATAAVLDNTEAIEENWQAQLDASGAVLSLRDAQNAAEAAYDDATKALDDNGKTLNAATEKGRANRAALDDIAESGYALVDSMRASGASSSELSGAMATTRERFIKTAQAMGLSRSEARELANQLGLIPKNVSVKTSVDTAGAKASVQSLVQYINGLNATIAVRERHVSSGAPGSRSGGITRAEGGRLPGFPTGGRLPGNSPADPMQDNLLGVDGAGVPRVRVRSREWVVNEPAADYYGDGIMGALNARKVPREAFSGLLGLARGGAVGSAQRELQQQLRFRKDAAARVHKNRANDRKDDTALSARALADAEERLAKIDERIGTLRSRIERLSGQRSDARRSLRRGDFRDSVTGGLSGAQSTVDSLFDLAFSGDLTKRQSSSLAGTARASERALTGLYKRAESLETKLAAARDRLAEMQQISDGVSSGLAGEQNLSDAFTTTTNPWSGETSTSVTAGGLVAGAEAKKRQIQMFAGRLKKLAAAGLAGPILQEIAGMGTEVGIQAADALLADVGSIDALNAAYKGIDFYAAQAGQAVTAGFGGGGLAGAAAAAASAEAQVAAIDKKIGKWADVLAKAYAKALGIKARASGGPILGGSAYLVGEQGPEMIVPQASGYVMNARQTANLTAGPQKVVYVNVTQHYPQAIPYSKAVNNALQHAAEGIV